MITEYYANVLAQSRFLGEFPGLSKPHTLTTMHICLPWYITPELLRHRMFSFSSASTRAIGTHELLAVARDYPALPLNVGPNCKGMQSKEEFEPEVAEELHQAILELARYTTNELAEWQRKWKPHKQFINKYMIPFLWCNVVITGTGPAFANFLALRCDEGAAPEMQKIGGLIADAYIGYTPTVVGHAAWHLPMMVDGDREAMQILLSDYSLPEVQLNFWIGKLCAARVARISIKTHGDHELSRTKDLELYNRLTTSKPMHASPLEHIAWVDVTQAQPPGNFGFPWNQLRHKLANNTTRAFVWKGVTIA